MVRTRWPRTMVPEVVVGRTQVRPPSSLLRSAVGQQAVPSSQQEPKVDSSHPSPSIGVALESAKEVQTLATLPPPQWEVAGTITIITSTIEAQGAVTTTTTAGTIAAAPTTPLSLTKRQRHTTTITITITGRPTITIIGGVPPTTITPVGTTAQSPQTPTITHTIIATDATIPSIVKDTWAMVGQVRGRLRIVIIVEIIMPIIMAERATIIMIVIQIIFVKKLKDSSKINKRL